MKKPISILLLSTLFAFSSVSVLAKTSEQSISFLKGKDAATQAGSFTGYDDIQYKIYAKKGQTLKFNISSNNNLAYINIFAPGTKPGEDQAIVIGSTVGESGEIVLPANGEYTIQVYQMRNSARQNKTVNYKLYVQILNESNRQVRDFDATGELPCSLALGQPTRQCKFGVVRQGNGSAQVTVFTQDNKTHVLKFQNGKLVSPKGKTQKRSDLYLIELATHERFEMPEAVIYGG